MEGVNETGCIMRHLDGEEAKEINPVEFIQVGSARLLKQRNKYIKFGKICKVPGRSGWIPMFAIPLFRSKHCMGERVQVFALVGGEGMETVTSLTPFARCIMPLSVRQEALDCI